MPRPNTGTVDLSTTSGIREYVYAKLQTQQTTNIAAGDHVKFDTVYVSRGLSVVLDTTTAYVTTAGAAAIGRFTLKANRTYHLVAQVPYILGSGATGLLDVAWYDATAAAEITTGNRCSALVATTATHDIGGGVARAIFQPGQDSLVELRIITATALTQIGTTGARVVTALVETY